MTQSEIDAVRALLTAKPRPVGWAERRQRLDEVGSVWPVADDVQLTAVDLGGIEGEWSIVPGSNGDRVMLFFHGGGYCSGSIRSHRHGDRRRRAAGMHTRGRLSSGPEHPFPAALDDALTAWFSAQTRRGGCPDYRRRQRGRRAGVALINTLRDSEKALPPCAWLVSPWTDLTMSGSTRHQGRDRSIIPQGLS
jgi:acetyl esterase/lipase